MKKAQSSKIENVGSKNNMSKQESMKAYYKICEFFAHTISTTERNEDGTFDPEKFKVLHITNFGKFVPNRLKVIQMNKALVAKKAKRNNNDSNN